MAGSEFSWHRIRIVLADMSVVLAAYVLAFGLRFDFSLDPVYVYMLVRYAPYVLACYALTAYAFGLNHSFRHYHGFTDMPNIMKAVGAFAVLQGAAVMFVSQGKFPRSVLLMTPILAFFGTCVIHALARYGKALLARLRASRGAPPRRVVLLGAGELGEMVLRQLQHSHYEVAGILDEDRTLWGLRVRGVPVVGGLAALPTLAKRGRVDELIVTVAARRGEIVRGAVEAARGLEHKPQIRIAPTLEEMLKTPGGSAPRQVTPADLLNRKEVLLDAARIARMIEGKTVLVTGAGGTIGSELSRQVLRYNPGKIVLLENHATALFYREAELLAKPGAANIVPVLGDIRDQGLLQRLFKEHRPHVILHAAAHKHVHQLESNVREGISNNLLGTYYLAQCADESGAEAFLLISTDKAVRPSCVMGATKRAAERVVAHFAGSSRTRFMAVRFGNVLGSSGSVLKIFQEQIAKGGAITVTHPEATRYFMTVEEAAGLILQAVTMAKGGEIFVLNMGTPVRIMDMAKNLILLSGLEPDRDVPIRVTGLRPGEKLHEELVEASEGCQPSEHPDIMVLRFEDESFSDLPARILDVELASRSAADAALLLKLRSLVPTFNPAAGVSSSAARGT